MRRALVGMTLLGGSLCVLALVATPAFADRSFSTTMTGFNGAFSVAIDGNNNVWVTDRGQFSKTNPGVNGVYKYDPFPSQTLLATPNTYSPFAYYIDDLTAAVDDATGEIFVAQSNGRAVYIFAPVGESVQCKKEGGETYCYTHNWTRINGANTCFNCLPDIHIAIDNTDTFSRGRVYLSLTGPENDIEVFDSDERPVDLPATASYIENNKLTGTPSGHFGEVANVAVDNDGNVYVTDVGKKVVDEFDSTGTFVHAFPAPQASQGYPGIGGAGVDPTNGNVLIDEGGYNAETGEGGVREFDSSGNYLETLKYTKEATTFYSEAAPAVNSNGYVYVPTYGNVNIFSPAAAVPNVTYQAISGSTTSSGTMNATIELNGGGNVTECKFEYGTTAAYGAGTIPCSPTTPFSASKAVSAELSGLTTGTTYHYRVVAKDANGTKYGEDQTYTPQYVLGLRTDAATGVTESGATLNGSFYGNGEVTHYHFEWGRTQAYGNATTASATSPAPGSKEPVSFPQTGLAPFSTYHYRVVSTNGGGTSYGEDQMFTTLPGIPSVVGDSVTETHADRTVFHGQVNPNGADTRVSFEYITESAYKENLAAGREGFAGASTTAPGVGIGMSKHVQTATQPLAIGLQPGTVYHFRAVGTNEAGEDVAGFDNTFTTFPFEPEVSDHCPNAHVRQQTGTTYLLDCRAYELVSAANSGGYDVESNLVAGQTPFENYPEAESPSGQPRVLYGVHDGGIPGTGDATNRGVDPYVATRGEKGWSTSYVGIPANGTPSTSPFSSTLADADAALDTFAFGGPEICSPCFKDGSTGNPIRGANGELVQGMAGSMPQAAAKPAGFIGKHLSADGTHFIFGSVSQFEPDGNSNGDVSIYDRNLTSGITHVVSKTPGGQTMTGSGIGELDVSKDGSRIVIGQLFSEEGEAKYWHLYMNIGDSNRSIDLTPAATRGVLYDGMTVDGSKVFFSSEEHLTGEDTQHSGASIYEAEVSESGATLHLISKGNNSGNPGEPGNTASCEPSANTAHEPHWNTTGTEANCGVVAVGGGGGVAKASGTIYFLSPELLDGSEHGVQNAPNLYVARPGSLPHFVATLESSSNAPLPPTTHPFVRNFGAFSNPTGVAVDHATGDIYVLDAGIEIGQGFVYKFTSSGNPILSFGNHGKLTVSGMLGFYDWPTQIAVDNSCSVHQPTPLTGSACEAFDPSNGDFYVPEIDQEGGKFNIQKYGPSGEHLATLESFFPTGVSVDPANGNVYATSYYGYLLIYTPQGEITTFDYISENSPEPEGVAVDSAGNAYVVNGGGQSARRGTTEVYHPEGAGFIEEKSIKQLDPNPSYGVALDPSDEQIYVDEGNQVSEFNSSGEQVGTPSGAGVLTSESAHHSTSLAADSGTLDVSNPGGGDAVTFGLPARPSDPQTDNPLVIDSVSSPGARHSADFQVTPSGDDAAFTSTLPVTGYDNGLIHREVFRYDATNAVECASCSPTGEQATGEASLPSDGLGLSNDGRVFFNSTEGLVDRDLNEKEDVYEWEPEGFKFEFEHGKFQTCETTGGCVQLISTGASPFDSQLLGISANGTDAYFFTRDKLAEEDENGNSVKIYDARELGGFPFVPPAVQCKASDECHGPGSPIPPPPNIKSLASTPGGNASPQKCKAGFAKVHGSCVRHKGRGRKRHRGGRRHG